MQERAAGTTFQGAPLTVRGPQLQVGDRAPGFRLQNGQLQMVTHEAFLGKTLLLSVAPSLDTPVCALQAKRFHQEVGNLPPSAVVVMVTADLPFAQARFCGAEGVSITTLSDHLDMSFGDAYGTHILPLRLESRALSWWGRWDDQTRGIRQRDTEHPNTIRALEASGRTLERGLGHGTLGAGGAVRYRNSLGSTDRLCGSHAFFS
jgi:thiol peroxidase